MIPDLRSGHLQEAVDDDAFTSQKLSCCNVWRQLVTTLHLCICFSESILERGWPRHPPALSEAETEEKCLRSGHELLEKALLSWEERTPVFPPSFPPSLSPACPCFPSLRYDMFSGEMHLPFPSFSPPLPPPFFFLIGCSLSVDTPSLLSLLRSFTHLYKLFKEWIRSHFPFLSDCARMFITGGFSGRVAALNQTLLPHTLALWSFDNKGGLSSF